MSTQIAVRLSDEQIAFIDDQIQRGEASSRAEVVKRALAREVRRQRTLRDVEILKEWQGRPDPDDLDALAEYAARVPRDDLD